LAIRRLPLKRFADPRPSTRPEPIRARTEPNFVVTRTLAARRR
jgi:hypothetical protein